MSQALVLVLNNNLFFRFPIEDALARQGRRGAFAQTDARFAEADEAVFAFNREKPDFAVVKKAAGRTQGVLQREPQALYPRREDAHFARCRRRDHDSATPTASSAP